MSDRFSYVAGALVMALLCPNLATGAVYRYQFAGNAFSCPQDLEPSYREDCQRASVPSPFSGALAIDETRMPGGALDGARLSLRYAIKDTGFGTPGGSVLSFELNRGGQTYTDTLTNPRGGAQDYFGFLRFDGIISDTLFSVIWEDSSYALAFDQNRQITDWTGDSGLTGGSGDFFTSARADSFATGARAAPGQWNMQPDRISAAPLPPTIAAVPLPAGISFLGLALGGVFLLKRGPRKRA